MSARYTMILVPETHWDREWYATFQQFRLRLVRLGDKLLDILDTDPRYTSFTWDGQTVVLEDYLEVRPENEGKLREYVGQKRLLVGPWYVLPDEFLVSGESLVRNLMLGHRIARRFGHVMQAGYIPDPFGHIGQLPAILRGFGLDNAIFMRGLGNEWEGMTSEFWWEGLDGSEVLVCYQLNSYCNLSGWGRRGEEVDRELALQQVKDQLASLSAKAATPYLLLNNGCDHVEPQPELPDLIAYVNERLEGAEVVQGTYEEYVARVKEALPGVGKLTGELHAGRYFPLLPGVFSARTYLKQANERTQTMLERWAEPLSAMAWLYGGRYEDALLWQAWKLCLQNHPHDSICGCSIDQVHREMLPRFAQSQQIGEALAQEAMEHIAGQVDTSFVPEGGRAVVLFNTLGQDFDGVVTVKLTLGIPAGQLPQPFIVTAADGQEYPAQTLSERTSETRSGVPHDQLTREVELAFPARVPAMGWAAYGLREGVLPAGETDLSCDLLGRMANGLLDVWLTNDGEAMIHTTDGLVQCVANVFESVEDAGDEYNWSPAVTSQVFTTEGVPGRVALVENGPYRVTYRVDLDWSLPARLTADRLARSEELVPCPITTFVTMHSGSARLDFRTVVDNRARDHRLRVLIKTGLSDLAASYAETQFGVVERPVALPPSEGWSEQPVGQHAVQSFVDANDGETGVTVINQGLPEYELRNGPHEAVLCQTLLRAVGWLSRDDYPARPYHAGPKMETPEAQCLGRQEFRYAVLPHVGTWETAQAWRPAHELLAPPRAVLIDRHRGGLPAEQSVVRVEPAGLVLSAVKKAEGQERLVVRVYNTTNHEVAGRLAFGRPVQAARLVNLDEQPVADMAAEGQTVAVQVRPFQIVTVEVAL